MESDSESFVVRRTESVDAQSITKLVKRATESVFGRINVENVIERANLAISLASPDGAEILGHMSFLDYPNWSCTDQADWEAWLRESYDCPLASPVTSLFLHLFVAKDGFLQGTSTEILHTVFMAVPLLQYVFLVVPEGVTIGSALDTHFSLVPLRDRVASPSGHNLYVTHRYQHFPMLHVRTARVEDADDLMPIFQTYTGDISQQYGEYFMAELIESQDDSHKTLVAEVNGRAVGFVSVSTEVDVDLLNSCYQLEPFHGLRHSSEGDKVLSVFTDATPPESLASSSLKSVPATEDQAALQKSSSALRDQPSGSLQDKSGAPLLRKSTVTISEDASQGKLEGPNKSQLKEASYGGLEGLSRSRLKDTSQSKMKDASQSKMKDASQRGLKDASQRGLKDASQGKLEEAVGPQKSLAAMTETKLTESQPKITQSRVTIVQSTIMASTSSVTGPAEGKGQPMASQTSVSEDKGDEVSSPLMSNEEPQPSDSAEAAPPTTGRGHRRKKLLSGECSAVAIQLFAIDEAYEMRSIDFLPAIFQLFPDHDFCLLTQPHSKPEFPLLTHFTRVNPKVGTTLPQELYVLHKCALLHSFAVRRASLSDIAAVKALVSGLEGGGSMVEDVQRYVEGRRDPLEEGATPIFAAVAECVGQVVGVAVLRQEEDIEYIHSHYNIEDFVYFAYHRPEDHTHLHHMVLNPAFAPYTKHFIKELLRLSHTTCLYCPLHHPPISEGLRLHTISSALGEMVPIRSRRQVSYPVNALGVNAPWGGVLEKKEPFALYHTNRKLTLEPKITVNARVVVVGASDTAISFLETLVFSPHLRFNNLTLVAPHGMPRDVEDSAYHLLPHSCSYWPASYRLMGLKAWVNVVHGTMEAIHRSEQEVVVEGETGDLALVGYDLLVLCTGTHFQAPDNLAACGQVFILKDEHEAAEVMAWAENQLIPGDGNLVIYGSSLEAYTAVQGLLHHGLPPSRITLVQPRPPHAFNNPVVEESVGVALEGVGLNVHMGFSLERWAVGEDLLTLQFSDSEERTLVLDCKGVVYLDGELCVDTRTFKAVNDACLVFDQRLVVDNAHHTNDPCIFAAGPLTKFSRRYRADQWTHANFNSKEVGQKLASAILSYLDPTLGGGPSEEALALIPSYSLPKATTAVLPGGLHYLHIEKPNQGERLAELMDLPDYGRELITDTESGYFRVHVNQYSRLQTITVLSKQPLESTNYLCLYGLHEKYLNNLLSRFDENLISDLFSFFREPWTCAVFHDRFPDFVGEIREHLHSPLDGETESFAEHVQKLVEEEHTVSVDKHREQLLAKFSNSPLRTAVQTRLYHFLHFNSYHLPMYAKPNII